MAKIDIIGVIGQDYFYSDFLTDYANAKQQARQAELEKARDNLAKAEAALKELS